ncbi:MAG: ribonuclease HII [Proteobacteria bacterium]|nr:ribonuclease HII [Pseudomonadota bacterium]
MQQKFPNFSIEEQYNGTVIGIDEAGRGPLAGPVVAACVLLDRHNYPLKLNDSKKLSQKVRQEIELELKRTAKIGVGVVDEKIIDEINILNATKLAMKLAFDNLCKEYGLKPDIALIDGNFIPKVNCQAYPIIKGDQKSLSIAAASVIAKQKRDQIMLELDKEFPQYGWSSNQAYPTKFHKDQIKQFGICKYHRQSFSPVKEYVNN